MLRNNAVCTTCGTEDPNPDNRTPCPNCGDTRRFFSRNIVEPGIPVTDSISVTTTLRAIREFYRENPKSVGLHLAYAIGALLAHHFIAPFDQVIGATVGGIIASLFVVRPPFTKNT